MAKQTAIEWLYIKLSLCTKDELVSNYGNWVLEAKAIEKEQIEEAFVEGGVQYMVNIADDIPPKAEDYYVKTYAK